jgi:hypothetical protein
VHQLSQTVAPMRKLVLGFVGLFVTACTGPIPSVDSTTVPSTEALRPATTSTSTIPGPIRGALPDGIIYDIAFPTPRTEKIGKIDAGLVLEHDGDDVPLSVRFGANLPDEADLVFQTGDWTAAIDVPDSLGPGARDVIEEAVAMSTEVEMPVLELQPPLRWASPPQVSYDSFVVRSGCPEEAAACNPTHAVSVIPHHGVTLDTPISVQSYALRPRSDPSYLPPGPLTARWSPDVLWTGEEMIVWGGSANGGQPTFIDGAAFYPASNEWRLLSSPPLAGEQATRAIWAGTEMVVIGEEATVAWDPVDDKWRVISQGLSPRLDPGMTVAIGSEIFTWTSEGVHRLGSDGEWEALPDPGVGGPDLINGSVLRVVDSTLFAIGSAACERLITRWDGDTWSPPTRISLGASEPTCGVPNQTAVVDGTLILWDDTSGVVVSYDPLMEIVREQTQFPLPEIDHAGGPLVLDGRFLASAGLHGALFEAASGKWKTVEFPGLGTDADMVWTGDEVLMWAKCCYGPDDVDAWRWTPPSS